MSNIFRIIKSDMRRLFSNTMSVIIALGLIIMPSIFAWYNIMACWNVFDNTGNLTVAVANTDAGYKSDLIPLRVNIGDQVVSALRANDDIDWIFTDEEDAIDGARAGRYYAAVVIPESFSQDMLTFYSEDVEHGEIIYYTNEKKSAIAPKITDKGADSVAYQVNETFTQTLSEVALGVAESLSDYADDADATSTIATLSNHVREMGSRVDEAAAVLDVYATLADSSASLVDSSAALMENASSEVDAIEDSTQEGVSEASSLATTLKTQTENLTSFFESSEGAFDSAIAALDEVVSVGNDDSEHSASRLREEASSVRAQATRYSELARDLDSAAERAPESIKATLEIAASELETLAQYTEDAAQSLDEAADELESGNAQVQAKYSAAKQELESAKSNIASLSGDYEENIKPLLTSLGDEASKLADYLVVGTNKLDGAVSEMTDSTGSVTELLGDARDKITTAADDLRLVGDKFSALADNIDTALASGDAELLRQILGTDASFLASALAAPVGVERTAVFPVENFGSAMAPLYTTLALFIGALLIMVAVKPALSEKDQEKAHLTHVAPRQLFIGRFGIVAFLSFMQSTLMGLGNMYFLDVQVAHPWLFMLCFWVAGLVFSFIIYALVVSFANLGKAIAVLMLIVQVTGCGGSFPLQILPDFVQAVSPWLPATHVVNAMRAAMFGVYGCDFWISIGCLLLFAIPAALLGLALRKPLAGFMKWYVEKVESSKVIG